MRVYIHAARYLVRKGEGTLHQNKSTSMSCVWPQTTILVSEGGVIVIIIIDQTSKTSPLSSSLSWSVGGVSVEMVTELVVGCEVRGGERLKVGGSG